MSMKWLSLKLLALAVLLALAGVSSHAQADSTARSFNGKGNIDLGRVVALVLSDKNIAEVQKRMPNRNGMVMAPGLWHVKGKSDVTGSSCMTNCVKFVQIGSSLPPEVRNAQGNLAEQNRTFGPFVGVDTAKPPLKALPGADGVAHSSITKVAKTPADLFKDNNCSACHAQATKLVGPSTNDVAAKYKDQSGAEDMLVKSEPLSAGR